MERVQRVVVLSLILPISALPVVPAPFVGLAAAGAEAVQGDALARAQRNRNREQPRRGRLLVVRPAEQPKEL